jgi:hypothetical protein
MAIQYFATKAEADSVSGGETSWAIVKDGKPWRASTGADISPSMVDADRESVKAYAKLVALKNMTPAII